MANEVREPKQKRSIETKHKIIDASFGLFSEVGYFNTNTAEIAKRAGVSTGIVYGYFKDKRDILLEVLELYIDKVYSPILAMFDSLVPPLNFDNLIPLIVDNAIEAHKGNAKIHESLHALTHADSAVNEKFIELEDVITSQFTARLNDMGYSTDGLAEKIHLSMNIVQSFAHEYVYDNHAYIDYGKMHEIVCDSIKKLFV